MSTKSCPRCHGTCSIMVDGMSAPIRCPRCDGCGYVPSRRVEVSTNEYEFSHGKRPRGFGSWAFFFDRSMRIEDSFWVNQSTYGDAVKAAKVEAKKRNTDTVFVGS